MKFFKLIVSCILLIWAILFIRDSLPKGEMEIIPVDRLISTSPYLNNTLFRMEYYLVRNYVKSDSTDKLLDQLICERVAQSKLAGHSIYHGYYYKENPSVQSSHC